MATGADREVGGSVGGLHEGDGVAPRALRRTAAAAAPTAAPAVERMKEGRFMGETASQIQMYIGALSWAFMKG